MNDVTPSTDSPLICLQPIADQQHRWVALLLDTQAPLSCGQLTRLFGELGLFEAMGTMPCVVSIPNPRVGDEIEGLLPAEQIVLRLPVASCVEPEDCVALSRLRSLGFQLMADGLPTGRELCPQIAAIALKRTEATTAASPVRLGALPGHHLALGLETPQDFGSCRTAGFHWFAGNYPLHADGNELPRGGIRHALLMRLLTLVTRDADSQEIENLIKQDAQLSYQLLRLVNSVAFSLTREITSFGQAIALLGRQQLQRWLQLLLYAHPDKAARSPLLPRAALRASLIEALFADKARGSPDQAFMVGMFSLLDRLMGGKLADILAPLHLPADVRAALIEGSGPFSLPLRAVEVAEQSDHTTLAKTLATAGIDGATWTAALIRGYHWAIQVSREA